MCRNIKQLDFSKEMREQLDNFCEALNGHSIFCYCTICNKVRKKFNIKI